ncbi:MAG: hypothetical protein K9G76_02230 [Bacteroidales bacterium]|nr:hypothetical protein [Bacteroidales bacterium]MCF8404867.1 hypothetical protein [Bacteroidales bacterium]
MKKVYLLSLVFVALQIIGQESGVDLEKLKAPSSPASTIIGIQPSDISRPKSVKDVELSLFNNFTDNGSLSVPNDYALEFMPYWLLNKKNVDEIKYLEADKFKAMYSNLSLSVSSTTSSIVNDSINSNAIGVGLRTIIYKSPVKEQKKKIINMIILNRRINAVNVIFSTLINEQQLEKNNIEISNYDEMKRYISEYISRDDFIKSTFGDDPYYRKITKEECLEIADKMFYFLDAHKDDLKNIDAWEDKIDAIKSDMKKAHEIINIEDSITNYLTNRAGFQLELTGALSLNFPSNDFEYSRIPKAGIWLTGYYQNNTDSWIQYLILARYYRNDVDFFKQYLNNDSIVYSNSYDFGGKVVIWPSNKFTSEFEFIGRSQSTILDQTIENGVKTTKTQNDFNFKWTLLFNYQINNNLVITYTFGKNFDPLLKLNGNIISALGLNFGLGSPKI